MSAEMSNADQEAWLVDRERGGWQYATERAIDRHVADALANIPERRVYMDIQRWLDGLLGEEEEDGTGDGLMSDLAYAFEIAKRDALNAERNRLALALDKKVTEWADEYVVNGSDADFGRWDAWDDAAHIVRAANTT